MGWISDTWDSATDAVSSGWDSVTDAVSSGWESVKDTAEDITGVESMTSLMLLPGIAPAAAALGGKGILGEAVTGALSPLLQPPGGAPPQGVGPSGPLSQAAPNFSMGSGGAAPAVSVAPSSSDISSLFGPSGYSSGSGVATSTALLKPNAEAYQFSPLVQELA